MTDELLFSALGLTMDTNAEGQLFSPIKANQTCDYEVSCTTPLSDDFGIIDVRSNMTINPMECYTDLSCSSNSWNDWSTADTPTSLGTHVKV